MLDTTELLRDTEGPQRVEGWDGELAHVLGREGREGMEGRDKTTRGMPLLCKMTAAGGEYGLLPPGQLQGHRQGDSRHVSHLGG